MKRGLLLLAALLMLTVAPAPAANAATVTGYAYTSSAVLYPDCEDIQVSYSIQPSADVSTWSIYIEFLRPDGAVEARKYLSYLTPTDGTFPHLVCSSSSPPGTWTIRGTGEYKGADGLTHTWQLTPSQFTVRAAKSRTKLTKTPLGRGVYRLKVKVKDERPEGYRPTDVPTVVLERLDPDGWRRVDRALAVVHGKYSLRVSVKKLVTLRARTSDGFNYEGSTSRPVTLKP